MTNRYTAHNARRAAAVQAWHEQKARRPLAERRCSRCGEVHEFLFHGYCLGCRSEMQAQFAAENRAIRLAWERSIAEQDIHDELRRH